VEYLALIMFTVSTCGTPGPNNTMIMSSGVSYGFKRSLPHVIGINTGFPLMVVAVGLGLGGLLNSSPTIYAVLRVVAAIYLLYLAFRIATGPVTVQEAQVKKPLSVLQAALFQAVNPKTWVMIVGAVMTFAGATDNYAVYALQIVAIALIFLVFGTPCTTAWLLAGVWIRKLLSKPIQFRIFNVAMAALLVGSMIPLFGEIVKGLPTP
jgi:threonine/homoserine/homoserine lactone efflux protein